MILNTANWLFKTDNAGHFSYLTEPHKTKSVNRESKHI